MLVQDIHASSSDIELLYYRILSVMGNFNLTDRETQLLAFIAKRGNISYRDYKLEFVEKYGSSIPSINNMISRLSRKGLLVKDSGKVKISPKYVIDFSNNDEITLRLWLKRFR